MQLSKFEYDLPQELIAQTPTEPRDHSRLLNLNISNQSITESKFYDILDKLGDNDILVLNKTRVINARLNGTMENGNICEIFLHKQISDNTWDCLVYPGKKLKPGKEILFYYSTNNAASSPLTRGQGELSLLKRGYSVVELRGDLKGATPILKATIKSISEKGRIVEFNRFGIEFLEIIDKLGEIPLPPYIKEKLEDKERYQTVWNEVKGSVAAPTASLHFTNELLEKIQKKGVKIEKVLLHVGLGTFMGVETENILDHKMHSEYIELEKDVAERLNEYKKQGKRIIAVGTTAIRVLESFSDENGKLNHGSKDTNIFIYPGYQWKFVNAIITNFHLPKSTLLMLVSSFAGIEFIKKAYKHAVDNKFRFFSFGDAMFIEK